MWGDSAIASNVPLIDNEIGLPITGAATELPFAPSITAVARLPHNHQLRKEFLAPELLRAARGRGAFTDADKEQVEPSQASAIVRQPITILHDAWLSSSDAGRP